MKIRDIIKRLEQDGDQNYELVFDMFTEDAIRNHARIQGIALTPAQVSEVIKHIEDNVDSCRGVNWETIEDAINEICKTKEQKT